MTIDTDKAFDLLAYDFIIVTLRKFRLKPSSIDRMEIFLEKLKSSQEITKHNRNLLIIYRFKTKFK